MRQVYENIFSLLMALLGRGLLRCVFGRLRNIETIYIVQMNCEIVNKKLTIIVLDF